MIVYNVFPTPVGSFNLNRVLFEEEKKFIISQEKKTNSGNLTSINRYILKDNLKSIEQFINGCLQEFFTSIYAPSTEVYPYITQSWINYTKTGQYHHKHQHTNSFLSGVFYLNTNDSDKIYFAKDTYQQLKLETNNYNIYNSDSWNFDVKAGDLLIFPSSLSHSVKPVEGFQERISLSFNTFLKGNLGCINELTELIL